MPVTIKTVAPFYDKDSGVPPPLPCMLTDQLELFGRVPTSTCFLDNELLPPTLMGADALPSKNSVKPAFGGQPPMSQCIPSPAPYPQKFSKQRCTPLKISMLSDDDGSIDSTSDTDSTTSMLMELSEDSKIPKRPGEPGWPGRGGYNLEMVLGWNSKAYSQFKKCVHALVKDHLDVSKCMSAQDTTLLKMIKEKAQDKFPYLEDYSDGWPVNDLIMMRLKYSRAEQGDKVSS